MPTPISIGIPFYNASETLADAIRSIFAQTFQDSVALRDALDCYLQNPELRKEHGENGRRRVLEDFQPSNIWRDQYLELMRKHGIVRDAAF